MANHTSQLGKSRCLRKFSLGVCCFLVVALSVDSRLARSASVSGFAVPAVRPAAQTLRPAPSPSSDELMHDVATPPQALSASGAAGAGPRVRTLWMEVTAYCGCKKCCGPGGCGITASGRSIGYNGGLFVAADTDLLPFGTQLKIPGYAGDQPVEVIDRGSAIKGHHIDVFFASHEEAKAWGRRWMAVTIVE